MLIASLCSSHRFWFKRYLATMYLFCFQITTAINEIEKSTQHELNFIFHEISEVQVLLLFTFKSYALTLMWPKSILRDDNYTRYGINFMVTPKALCLLLKTNDCS